MGIHAFPSRRDPERGAMISLRTYIARLARQNRHETTTSYTRGRLHIVIECARCGSLARIRPKNYDLIGLDEPCVLSDCKAST